MAQFDIDKVTRNKALRNSIILHLFLLLIAWLLKFSHDPAKNIDTQYAVTVNFQREVDFSASKSSNSTKSSATQGRQRPKSPAPQKLEKANPKPVEIPKVTPPKRKPTPPTTKPTPTDPVISETTTEESDIQAVEEDIEIEDPEPEYVPEASPDPVPSEEPVVLNPDLPSLEDIIGDVSDEPIEIDDDTEVVAEAEPTEDGDDANNTPGKASGEGDGAPSLKGGEEGGTGRGESGTGKGRDGAGDDDDSGIGTGGAGEGEFDASGDGIFGRRVTYRDPSMLRMAASKSGKIVFKVCINRRGVVNYIEIDEYRTTITDASLLRQALESLRKYKYEPDPNAAPEECGRYTLKIDNFKGIGG